VADAKELVGTLPEFTHGGELDVTNIMLAPARVLCGAIVDADQRLAWNSWARNTRELRKDAREKLKTSKAKVDPRNLLAAELFESWECINQWLSPNVPEIKTADSREVLELERMMGLLTEIRLIGKGKPGNSALQTLAAEPLTPITIMTSKTQRVFRVLVVDDHARCWHSTIDLASKRAARLLKGSVEVDFSLDAKFVNSRKSANLRQTLLRYDLLLLDVFLPGGITGPDLLEDLRRQVNWLPVIVWTSSLSSQLAASAALHNGYLFKKTSSIKELSETFAAWLPVGNARRNYSLLNPLFDHAIISPGLRKVAVDFTLWCLKLLDAFHAVDKGYMKYFNDHGGRHVVALLNILEQLLRPLIMDGFPVENDAEKAAKIGEEELLALYLAVLCHEFGMFPLNETSFDNLNESDLKARRARHALVSFLTLMGRNKVARELKDLIAGLKQARPTVHALTAVISAYHSRFLSLERGAFTHLDKDRQACDRLSSAEQTDLGEALNVARGELGKHLESARKMSALFRFADAIEMDASRVPAPFLLNATERKPRQNREDLKRQLTQSVQIEDGCVSIRFNSPKPNKSGRWPCAAKFCTVLRRAKRDAESIADLLCCLKSVWPGQNLRQIREDHLDKWLDGCFEHGCRNYADVAVAAALSVVCDVVEEYEAIETVGPETAKVIRLCKIVWLGSDSLKRVDRLDKLPNTQSTETKNGASKPI
jgi:CheY-like chemotaxis protein